MFEMWTYKEDPSLRLVVAAGESLPAELGSRDWILLGPCDIDPDTAKAIGERGYHYLRSDVPVADPGTLKNSNATGA